MIYYPPNPRKINFLFKTPSITSKGQDTDPYWSSVKLLIRGEGSIYDDRGHTFSYFGNRPPEFNRSNSADGNGCISLIGNSSATTDYSSIYTNAKDFSIGDTDSACIEFWAKFPVIPTAAANIISCQESLGENAANWRITVTADGKISMWVGDSTSVSTEENLTGLDFIIPDTEWNHYAFVKEAKVISLYVNGKFKAASPYTISMQSRQDRYLSIGSVYNSWAWGGTSQFGGAHAQCYLDDIRITIGVKRYDTEFTVPRTTTFSYSGTVRDRFGNYASKMVCLYRRSTGELVNSCMSDATTGAWSLATPYSDSHFIVVIDTTQGAPNSILRDWL